MKRKLAFLAILGAMAGIPSTLPVAQAQETAKAEGVRPEVGRPLQAAQELIKSKNYREALAKISEADAIAGKTVYETYLIERLRASAAMQAGDNDMAIKAVGAILASGRLPAADQPKLAEAVVGMYYRAKDYAKAVTWAQRYFKDGGTSPQVRTLLIQSLYLNNEFAVAAKEIQTDIQAQDKVGQTPTEDRLHLLASCYLKLNDAQNYIQALELMVTHYPKKEYWVDLIRRIERKQGFAERLSLDVYRIRYATGNFGSVSDYMEMAQLAIQGGFPAEARKVVEQGYAKGVLGTGADAERHKRLRDMAVKKATEDQKALVQEEAAATIPKGSNALVNTGFNYVLLGQSDKGLELMEQGIRKGEITRPGDAALHLGVAYLMAGHKDKARKVLKGVQGTDGAADLARLWLIHSMRPS